VREPAGNRGPAPQDACILSDTGCIHLGYVAGVGGAPAVARGTLQLQGLGGRRLSALGLGPCLAQQRALAGHRGGMMAL
jgi:hypothetical protein